MNRKKDPKALEKVVATATNKTYKERFIQLCCLPTTCCCILGMEKGVYLSSGYFLVTSVIEFVALGFDFSNFLASNKVDSASGLSILLIVLIITRITVIVIEYVTSITAYRGIANSNRKSLKTSLICHVPHLILLLFSGVVVSLKITLDYNGVVPNIQAGKEMVRLIYNEPVVSLRKIDPFDIITMVIYCITCMVLPFSFRIIFSYRRYLKAEELKNQNPRMKYYFAKLERKRRRLQKYVDEVSRLKLWYEMQMWRSTTYKVF